MNDKKIAGKDVLKIAWVFFFFFFFHSQVAVGVKILPSNTGDTRDTG